MVVRSNMSRLDWLIIGGGIHGVHIAARLVGEAGVPAARLRIVDPGAQLLERWRRCTEATGMTHLRSPSVHHLDLNPWSLHQSAGARKRREHGLFAPPYDRPALGFFNEHCDGVIKAFGLDAAHVRARAVSCAIGQDAVEIGLSSGETLSAERVVLALGASEQPHRPSWAPRGDARVQHVFASGFSGWPESPEVVAVVGGGISAAQVALRLVGEGQEVHLISRHPLRKHQFDSDPGWLGPKYMKGFERERSVDRRRALISEARHRGSVPPDVHRALRRAIRQDELTWHHDAIVALDGAEVHVTLQLEAGAVVRVDRVVLATGFTTVRPGGALVDELVTKESLACARCGYPIVDRSLAWHPRIHVTGPLAELELGPTARNIHGARRAGDRIVRVAGA